MHMVRIYMRVFRMSFFLLKKYYLQKKKNILKTSNSDEYRSLNSSNSFISLLQIASGDAASGKSIVALSGRTIDRRSAASANDIARSSRGHTHIELIDVKCDATAGMLVTIEFEEPFAGIIYSQGYFNDPKCR